MIKATFTAGGLVDNNPCVYVVEITCPEVVWTYVGRTRSANNGGTSSPYKRLASHLAQRGETHSCIWNNCPNPLPPHSLQSASITFRAVFVPAESVVQAEKWLRWHLQQCGRRLLNREAIPPREPDLEEHVQAELRTLAVDQE
jgi:hypothetical protein